MNSFLDKIKEIWYYHSDFIMCVIIIPIVVTIFIMFFASMAGNKIQNSEINLDLVAELTTWCENKDIAPFIVGPIKQASADGKITVAEYSNIQEIVGKKTKELGYSKLLKSTMEK